MKKDPNLRLTKIQLWVLDALAHGAMITIDRMNMANLDGRVIQPPTRYFLTQHRLVTPADPLRSITTKGNGFIISPRGRLILQSLADKVPSPADLAIAEQERRRRPASDRQLAFADSLGLLAPRTMTMEEASDLLTAFNRVKHYVYGFWRDLTGLSAAESNLPRQDVEALVAELVNQQRPLADAIANIVGERDSNDFLLDKDAPPCQELARIVKSRWSNYLPPA